MHDVPSLYMAMFDSAKFIIPELSMGVDMDSSISWTLPFLWSVNISFFELPGHNMTSTPLRLALRIPSWTTSNATVDVRVQEAPAPSCDASQPGSFCILLSNFSSGDTIKMTLPMVAKFETLKDSRQHLQNYKSVIMGPFVLAGLTHDTSRVALPSDDVTDQLSAVDTAGLASILALPQKVYDKRNMCGDENHKDPYCRAEDIFTEALDGNGYYMKLNRRHVTAASDISTTADAMDATFRVVRAYTRGVASEALPFGTYPLGSTISLESMTMPGHFVGIDKTGVAVLEKDDGSAGFEARHSFIIREGNDGRSLGDNGITQATVSLELASSKGTFLLLPDQSQLDGKPRGDCMDSENTDFPCSTFRDIMASPLLQSSQNPCQVNAGELQVKCRKTCNAVSKTCAAFNKALITQPLDGGASTDAKTRSSFWFQPPLGRYHEGARVLKGTDRSYVLAPFYKIVEDCYTVYFDVQHS
ncbi:hypothetical protein COCOBI_09-5910 [Coccomyxa sp. Obi]|nr:hypothetical protein COCOBI_09-5910 [Coccomyxa sp. Obi]